MLIYNNAVPAGMESFDLVKENGLTLDPSRLTHAVSGYDEMAMLRQQFLIRLRREHDVVRPYRFLAKAVRPTIWTDVYLKGCRTQCFLGSLSGPRCAAFAPWITVKGERVQLAFWCEHQPSRNIGINPEQVVPHSKRALFRRP